MSQIALKLKSRNADATITLGQQIRTRMNASADVFTNPTVTMAELANQMSELQIAQQATLTGGTEATAIRNEKLKTLRLSLRQLALYVEAVAGGNVETILLAGMPLKRQRTVNFGAIAIPQNVKSTAVGDGGVRVRWQKVADAKSYEVEYCLDPMAADTWKRLPSVSASRIVATGLNAAKYYWFRVRSAGGNSRISTWSDPALQLVA